TVGHDVAYAMIWTNLKKMMTDKYRPRGEIKKLEVEMWNLKVKGTDVKYIDGLPDMIHGSVMASKPKTMQDAIEFASELMDKKINTLAERQAENKRKLDNNNQNQQQPPKKQGVAIAYTIGPVEKKENQGHYKSDYSKLKNQNHRNQAGGAGARRMVALGHCRDALSVVIYILDYHSLESYKLLPYRTSHAPPRTSLIPATVAGYFNFSGEKWRFGTPQPVSEDSLLFSESDPGTLAASAAAATRNHRRCRRGPLPDALDELVRECLTDERLIIRGDLNGHIGAAVDRYEGMHGGFGFGERNEEGRSILYFATPHDMVVANSFFKKRRRQRKREAIGRSEILWKNLKGEAVETFRATVCEKLSALEEDMSARNADQMWNTLANIIRDMEKDSLGVASESARTHSTRKESWWFCEEVQTKVAMKQSRFKELLACNNDNQEDIDLDKERYKVAKREIKIIVAQAKDKEYEDLYMKLDSKEGENDIYKIAKARERKRIDIGNVRYIKDEGAKMPDEWRLSEVIPIYKNKGDAQACSNYRGIKLLSHIMKLWERVIERRLRRETRVSENQFGFMLGRSTTEAIHLLGRLMEKYRERRIDLHMAFLDLEKACDSVSQSAEGLNIKIDKWREALEDNGLRVSIEKIEYLKCDFDRFTIRPAMLYGSECWPITKAQANKVEVAELRMLRRPETTPVRRVEAMLLEGSKMRGRPKLRWEDRLKEDMKELLLSEDMTSDGNA
nr:retrovirus-related Pol polyprotein LINE-1 [Tanacetum cinerariifolium]